MGDELGDVMDEIERLKEANRKLHRRVQIAEAANQSVKSILDDLHTVFKSSFYKTTGRRQAERGFIAYILKDLRRKHQELVERYEKGK